MLKIKEIILVFVVLLAIVAAEELKPKENQSIALGENVDVEGRRRHRIHRYLPYLSVLGFGGVHAIAAFLAIKIKLVILTALVGWAIFYGFKSFAFKGLGCAFSPPEIIRESIPYSHDSISFSSPHHDHSSYSNFPPSDHHDHSSYSNFPPSGYNGPDPYSAFSHDHESHASPSFSSYPSDSSPTISDVPSSGAAEISPYRRTTSIKQKRSIEDDFSTWTDLGFALMGVKTSSCKKRFVCEFEFRARKNPIMSFAYEFISQNLFKNYRNGNEERATAYADCERIYRDCRAPFEEPFVDDETDNETNEISPNANEQNNETTESNDIGRSAAASATLEPLGRLILTRSMIVTPNL